jgi:lipid II:glycine glycyltransferase (peptidoglycan interpeptide bridge formation enzyme)
VLAGVLIVGYGEGVVFKMSAWSGEQTKLTPNQLLHWRAMQWSRDRGYRCYDLEGIDQSVAHAIVAGDGVPALARHGTTTSSWTSAQT